MPPDRKHHPPAAKPTRDNFDPWNSSSTGHQRAENRLSGSTGWRDSRTTKLQSQLRSGHGGGRRLADTVGAGAPDPVPRKGWRSVREMLQADNSKPGLQGADEKADNGTLKPERGPPHADSTQRPTRKVFDRLCFYINGSTAPTISDHRLKHLIAEHGGRVNIMLGRRSVTHVILGTPRGFSGVGAGGGLSGSKIQKEITRVGGCGVKFVGVEWVLESIKAGTRLPEASFSNLNTAPAGQRSVYNIFKRNEDSPDGPNGGTTALTSHVGESHQATTSNDCNASAAHGKGSKQA